MYRSHIAHVARQAQIARPSLVRPLDVFRYSHYRMRRNRPNSFDCSGRRVARKFLGALAYGELALTSWRDFCEKGFTAIPQGRTLIEARVPDFELRTP
jgi:hypothetical protein